MINTYVGIGLNSFGERLKEVELLVGLAALNISNQELYDSICRSIQVFIVSHFEGAIKDFTRNVLDDINYHSNFKSANDSVKRTFCEHFMKVDKGSYSEAVRIRLIETFDKLPVDLSSEPFLVENNKNPSPNMISSVTKKFGILHFFSRLKGSDLEIIFEDVRTDIIELRDKLKKHLEDNTVNYPYTVNPQTFKLNEKDNSRFNINIWTSFIDDFLQKRHEIAHGNTLLNSKSHNSIEKLSVKIEILIYGMYLIICHELSKSSI